MPTGFPVLLLGWLGVALATAARSQFRQRQVQREQRRTQMIMRAFHRGVM